MISFCFIHINKEYHYINFAYQSRYYAKFSVKTTIGKCEKRQKLSDFSIDFTIYMWYNTKMYHNGFICVSV